MNKHNAALIAAVQHLYGKGIVKKDKDIADKTGYNKASVSSYLSGNVKASENFVKKFQQVYGLSLSDFRAGGAQETIKVEDPLRSLTEKMLQLTAVARVNQSLLIEVLAHQTGKTVMELNRAVSSAMDGELKQLVNELRPKYS